MKACWTALFAFCLVPFSASSQSPEAKAGHYTAIAWNDLGMHCMDSDYSVFSILPPFNVLHVQLIDSSGKLVTNASGLTCTYKGAADAAGSINTTSVGKTNFWTYVNALFGASLTPDRGLAGSNMPGKVNLAQPITWDVASNSFIAKGIPITPTDNALKTNYYPVMQITASNSGGAKLGTTTTVLPVSAEMDCRGCHASGSQAAAMPPTGWVNNSNPEKDYRLNVLRYHDEVQPNPALYQKYLTQAGYAKGLYASATKGTPVLCDRCHLSNALVAYGVPGIAGIAPLTQSIHGSHATAVDPITGLTLDDETNRTACYNCHPGSSTRCLRGAMGNAIAADGTMQMQCQSCHGNMSSVGAATRQGWLDEPNCQACHTGTATQNNGQIRYTTAFDDNGLLRIPVDPTFATNQNVPGPNQSLYRFSVGHGGLQCEACHGPTHAELPSSQVNDNQQSMTLQGHIGKLADCTACHSGTLNTTDGGPHGMHPIGASWISSHSDAVDGNSASCQGCHGADYKGSVLSYAQGNRTFNTDFGTKVFWQGFQISCYACHNGPSSTDPSPNTPPAATNLSASTLANQSIPITLKATDANQDPLTYRVVSQAANGTVGLSGNIATYFPSGGFTGTDTFTYAAWDGYTNSNLATVTVTVH